MILFNLWAVPVGIAIWLILLGIEHFFPSLVAGSRFGWTLGIVVTAVGGICEVAGIKARLFLLPLWITGVAIIAYHLGWPGTLSFLAILVVGGIFLFVKARKKEIADWNKAQLELLKAPVAPVDGTERHFWGWVKDTLFLPIWMKFTPELCQHNLTVLDALKNAKASFSKAEIQRIEALETFLKAARTAAKPMGSEVKLQEPVCDFVNKKFRRADPKKPFVVQGPPALLPPPEKKSDKITLRI